MIILGIDPGTATTGYGLIKLKNKKLRTRKNLKCLDYGLIQTSPSSATPDRLKTINNELDKIITIVTGIPIKDEMTRLHFLLTLSLNMPVGISISKATRKNADSMIKNSFMLNPLDSKNKVKTTI